MLGRLEPDDSLMAERPKPKLDDDGRAFVVHALACFDSPGLVVIAVRKEFGVTITPQSVEGYDPTKRAGQKLSEKWKALFTETRKAFLADSSSIPVSHRSARLRRLDRMAIKAEESGNMALAAQLLEQAAKECGDAFTNRHRIDASVSHRRNPQEMTDEELAAIASGGSSPGITDTA